jgi:hypothetical protein
MLNTHIKHSYVDYATQKRYPKASANWYTKLVQAHKDGSSNGNKSNGKKSNGNKHDSNLAGNGVTSTDADSTKKSGVYTPTIYK